MTHFRLPVYRKMLLIGNAVSVVSGFLQHLEPSPCEKLFIFQARRHNTMAFLWTCHLVQWHPKKHEHRTTQYYPFMNLMSFGNCGWTYPPLADFTMFLDVTFRVIGSSSAIRMQNTSQTHSQGRAAHWNISKAHPQRLTTRKVRANPLLQFFS